MSEKPKFSVSGTGVVRRNGVPFGMGNEEDSGSVEVQQEACPFHGLTPHVMLPYYCTVWIENNYYTEGDGDLEGHTHEEHTEDSEQGYTSLCITCMRQMLEALPQTHEKSRPEVELTLEDVRLG